MTILHVFWFPPDSAFDPPIPLRVKQSNSGFVRPAGKINRFTLVESRSRCEALHLAFAVELSAKTVHSRVPASDLATSYSTLRDVEYDEAGRRDQVPGKRRRPIFAQVATTGSSPDRRSWSSGSGGGEAKAVQCPRLVSSRSSLRASIA